MASRGPLNYTTIMQEVMLPYMHLDEVTTVYRAFLNNEKRLAIIEP